MLFLGEKFITLRFEIRSKQKNIKSSIFFLNLYKREVRKKYTCFSNSHPYIHRGGLGAEYRGKKPR